MLVRVGGAKGPRGGEWPRRVAWPQRGGGGGGGGETLRQSRQNKAQQLFVRSQASCVFKAARTLRPRERRRRRLPCEPDRATSVCVCDDTRRRNNLHKSQRNTIAPHTCSPRHLLLLPAACCGALRGSAACAAQAVQFQRPID